jgi:hypothetical protein
MNLDLFSELLSKEVTRKEFLLHLGLLFLALTGISGLLNTLSNPYPSRNKIQPQRFDRGPYGL